MEIVKVNTSKVRLLGIPTLALLNGPDFKKNWRPCQQTDLMHWMVSANGGTSEITPSEAGATAAGVALLLFTIISSSPWSTLYFVGRNKAQ